jgi:hypothetical protein
MLLKRVLYKGRSPKAYELPSWMTLIWHAYEYPSFGMQGNTNMKSMVFNTLRCFTPFFGFDKLTTL